MINVGIANANTPLAGELLRILVNHPDVNIHTLQAEGFGGQRVDDVHYGLYGDFSMTMSETIDLSKLSILFIAGRSFPMGCNEMLGRYPDLKIVNMTMPEACFPADSSHGLPVPGLSEIFRKPLVRGARNSALLSPSASIALVGLYPLAANLLLRSPIELEVCCPRNFFEYPAPYPSELQIGYILAGVQQSFTGPVKLNFTPAAWQYGMRISFTIPCGMAKEDVERLYESVYDDHNFTFLTDRPRETSETAGTQKCLISLSNPQPGKLRVEIVADPAMRGGAGEAVHIMNLLFGLHEKTGLSLRALPGQDQLT